MTFVTEPPDIMDAWSGVPGYRWPSVYPCINIAYEYDGSVRPIHKSYATTTEEIMKTTIRRAAVLSAFRRVQIPTKQYGEAVLRRRVAVIFARFVLFGSHPRGGLTRTLLAYTLRAFIVRTNTVPILAVADVHHAPLSPNNTTLYNARGTSADNEIEFTSFARVSRINIHTDFALNVV